MGEGGPAGQAPAPHQARLQLSARRAFSAGWAGLDARWAGHVPHCHVPPGPAPCAAAQSDLLGRGPGRPVQAYLRARERNKEKERSACKSV